MLTIRRGPRAPRVPGIEEFAPRGGDRRSTRGELTNLEQEALTEVGNIILNAWLATRRHGGQWHRRVRPRIPRARRLSEIVAGTERDADTLLMLSIQFDLRELEINGRLLFLLEFAKLRSLINAIAGRLLGGAAGSA